jgi:hypothetical protein
MNILQVAKNVFVCDLADIMLFQNELMVNILTMNKHLLPSE